jgi:hypothetical protein
MCNLYLPAATQMQPAQAHGAPFGPHWQFSPQTHLSIRRRTIRMSQHQQQQQQQQQE